MLNNNKFQETDASRNGDVEINWDTLLNNFDLLSYGMYSSNSLSYIDYNLWSVSIVLLKWRKIILKKFDVIKHRVKDVKEPIQDIENDK